MKPLNNLDQAKDKMADLFDKVQDNFDILSEHGGGVDQSLQELENSKAEVTDLSILKSRVDNLVANPGTSTEGNLELIDIRVGADGVLRDTAGNSIRSQFTKIFNLLSNKAVNPKLFAVGKNLALTELSELGFISNNVGYVQFDPNNDQYFTTWYLSVEDFDNDVVISGDKAIRKAIAFDKYFNAISSSYVDNPSNSSMLNEIVFKKSDYPDIAYIRFSYYKSKVNAVQLEDAISATTYESPVVLSRLLDLISSNSNQISELSTEQESLQSELTTFINKQIVTSQAANDLIHTIADVDMSDGLELTWDTGYISGYATLNDAGNSAYHHTSIEVTAGQMYLIQSVFYKAIQPWVFKSKDGVVVTYNDYYKTFNSSTRVIPLTYLFDCNVDGTLYLNKYRDEEAAIKGPYKFLEDIASLFTIKPSLLPSIPEIPDEYSYGYKSNILYGKKWAVCGDSFSNGDFSGSTEDHVITDDGPYKGKNMVYGYIIGNRNNMNIQHLAAGGRTIATPADGSFSNAFSKDLYKTIDTDVDYITLYFGINDSHHRPNSSGSDGEDQTGVIEVGTINDTVNSTFYGAWNVVLEYLITNYPMAHIGILVSNGCETDEYRQATIAIANKWGIPYIDLNGDEHTPMMNRSTNPNASSVVKNLRSNAFKVGGSNGHPSAKAHAYESTFIEAFLRRL